MIHRRQHKETRSSVWHSSEISNTLKPTQKLAFSAEFQMDHFNLSALPCCSISSSNWFETYLNAPRSGADKNERRPLMP